MYGLLTKFVRSRWMGTGQVSFRVFMDRNGFEVHKRAKKDEAKIISFDAEQTWSIKDLLHGFRKKFSCGIQRVVPRGQDSSILSILPAR